MNQNRLDKLTQQILANGLDGIALMPGPNMVYITGIEAHISERPMILFIPADDDPAIITPLLEAPKAQAAGIPEARIFAWSDDEGYTEAFQRACAHLELSDFMLGIEALAMRALELELLHRYAPGLATVHVEPIMAELRQSKDRDELGAIRRAIAVAEKAMENLLPRISVGQSEKQIASMLVYELTKAGSQAIPFGPIVSAGPNGALPHAIPTERKIQPGDLLVIDWGAMVDGYPSDITRTYGIGQIETEFKRIYEIVNEANAAAKETAGPAVTGAQVDRAARRVIEQAGYGEYFIHRTGHGLGLEVHEPPAIVSSNNKSLPIGSVFTIEPGIYLPGRAGVRIEDDVLITSDGCRTLTTLSWELKIIG